MTTSEKTMIGLTAIGLFVAVLTGLIFWKQLKQMRIDQRAWVTAGNSQIQTKRDPATGNVSLSAEMGCTNAGKTPGRRYVAEFIMTVVQNGNSPSFDYSVPHATQESGIVYPNSTVPFRIEPVKKNPNTATGVESDVLSAAQFTDLQDAKSYVSIYGRTTYLDVFGTSHWQHFCMFWTPNPGPVQITARECTGYNDVDDNN
jgi:hypothetical protein